jgi:hypothetical protein
MLISQLPPPLAVVVDFDFVIVNPLYVTQFNNRTYVFTHGTHFRHGGCIIVKMVQADLSLLMD